MANAVAYDVMFVLLDECITHFKKCCHQESFQAILEKLVDVQKNLNHVKYVAITVIG